MSLSFGTRAASPTACAPSSHCMLQRNDISLGTPCQYLTWRWAHNKLPTSVPDAYPARMRPCQYQKRRSAGIGRPGHDVAGA
eukprot:1978733-Rhodomonas_salina.2